MSASSLETRLLPTDTTNHDRLPALLDAELILCEYAAGRQRREYLCHLENEQIRTVRRGEAFGTTGEADLGFESTK